jgi:flagellin FlaB
MTFYGKWLMLSGGKINNKAEMGIGTLIIFIAMILVAAIAAGVLIQTGTSLQNKALLTGERSKSQVSTSLSAITVYAEDGTTGTVNRFFVKLKLAPGSDPIALNDSLISVGLNNVSNDMIYYSIGSCANINESNGTRFYVDYLIESEAQADGYLQRGDVVNVCFESSRNVQRDENIEITVVPKIGNTLTIETAMPDVILDKRVIIFP